MGYAISFDLDTTRMKVDGVSPSPIYNVEIPRALKSCGFGRKLQRSTYATSEDEVEALRALVALESTIKSQAPNFAKYAKHVYVFRTDSWTCITHII